MFKFSILLLAYFFADVRETLSLGNTINIAEGNDLYLSLPNDLAPSMYETCKLYGPNDEEVTEFEVDTFNRYSCGYIITNVNSTHDGTWIILYGNQLTYRMTYVVNILESIPFNTTLDNLVWTLGSSVDIIVGPEDAVYCTIRENRFKGIVSEGFGPCRIVIDRVTMDHSGQWVVSFGMAGNVVIRNHVLDVEVKGNVTPVVTTNVVRDGISMVLTCSVPVENEISACQFRDPNFNLMITSNGVGQGVFVGAITSYESNAESHSCTLRTRNFFSSAYEGMWRCAVNTTHGVSYGFLRVPRLQEDVNSDTDYHSELVLRSPSFITAWVGDAMTMSCSIDSAIRYCYFRASNGTVFSVGPAITSPNYQYVGNGFDAGDCGIRFNNMWKSDAGSWTCHVGLNDSISIEEKSRDFDVYVDEFAWTRHEWVGCRIRVEMSLSLRSKLDYCRFVRSDGLGFTFDNAPAGYSVDEFAMLDGSCILMIDQPTMLDRHSWTVAAKYYRRDGELVATTNNTLLTLPVAGMSMASAVLLWMFVVIVCLLLILAAVSLISKNNRRWTYERAARIRNSFGRRPQQAPQTHVVQQTNAVQPNYKTDVHTKI